MQRATDEDDAAADRRIVRGFDAAFAFAAGMLAGAFLGAQVQPRVAVDEASVWDAALTLYPAIFALLLTAVGTLLFAAAVWSTSLRQRRRPPARVSTFVVGCSSFVMFAVDGALIPTMSWLAIVPVAFGVFLTRRSPEGSA